MFSYIPELSRVGPGAIIELSLERPVKGGKMARGDSRVVGIWKLISVQTEADDGTVTYPFGKDVTGLLMIDAKGYFSVQLMDTKRPSFESGDPRGGTPEEVKMAFENYMGYYGTFDLDETKEAVIFHVRGAWLPNWIGTDQIRYYTLHGNRMSISTAPVLFEGKNRVGKLIWERLN
jgi:hypothetical protein